MRAIECTLTQKVKKVALSLLHGAISFPEKSDLLPSAVSSPAWACRPLPGAQTVASLRGGVPVGDTPRSDLRPPCPSSAKGREGRMGFLGPGGKDGQGANHTEGGRGRCRGVRGCWHRATPSLFLSPTPGLWLWLQDSEEEAGIHG